MPLYHYTSAEVVYSILKEKEVWMTDIDFMNDSEERLEGLRAFISQANFLIKREIADQISSDHWISELDKYVYNRDGMGVEPRPVYAFCLSSEPNLLSQWRSYGRYCIEFDDEVLKAEFKEQMLPCIYDFEEKRSRAKIMAEGIMPAIHSPHSNKEHEDLWRKIIEVQMEASSFKHEDFHEERETRVTVSRVDEPKYRFSGDNPIPYIVQSLPDDCIKCIHVGPMKNQDVAVKGVKSVVEHINARNNKDRPVAKFHRIDVQTSNTPYRG